MSNQENEYFSQSNLDENNEISQQENLSENEIEQMQPIEYKPFEQQGALEPQKGKHKKPKAKREKSGTFSKKAIVAAIVICMLFSAGFGFGGGYLASKLGVTSTGTVENKVIYQSVARDTSNTSTTQTGTPLSVSDIAALVANSVVEITTETVTTGSRLSQYVSQGAGSGVIVTADGYIATNNHVIDGASKITVRLKNGTSYSAKLVGTDVKTDIAVIKIDATGLQPNVYGDSSKLEVGQLAVAIGNPLGELGGTVTDGIISALDRQITIDGGTMTLLQTNAAINPGNSGGGLFNSNGELIGIVNAKSSGSGVEGLGFAIPINTAKPIIEQLIDYGYVPGRISLGLTIVDVTDAQSAMMYRVSKLGPYVSAVTSGSNADTAGFTSGDCIISIDGTAVSTSSDISTILDQHAVGDKLSFVVYRGNKNVTLNLTLAEDKPANILTT